MRKPMSVISVTVLLAALIVGRSCPLQAVTCAPSVPVSADNLISMKDFGAVPNQGTALDIAPLFNCALTFAKNQRLRAIYFGWGDYTFLTPPQAIDFPITIVGDGRGRTQLFRDYTASSPSEGLLTFVAGSSSSSVRDLGIVAASGSSHGSAISSSRAHRQHSRRSLARVPISLSSPIYFLTRSPVATGTPLSMQTEPQGLANLLVCGTSTFRTVVSSELHKEPCGSKV